MLKEMPPDAPILFFDGTCQFCNLWVRFVLDRDAAQRFHFSPLESAFARGFFADHGWSTEGLDSAVLFKDDRFYVESDAVVALLGELPGIWSLGRHFELAPKSLRDPVYRWVASVRYHVFGRREACRVPSPEEAARFHF